MKKISEETIQHLTIRVETLWRQQRHTEKEKRCDDSLRGRPGCQWAAPVWGCASTSWVWGCAHCDHSGICASPCRCPPPRCLSCPHCLMGCFPCYGQLWRRWFCSQRENGEEMRDLPVISLSLLHPLVSLYQLDIGGNAFGKQMMRSTLHLHTPFFCS